MRALNSQDFALAFPIIIYGKKDENRRKKNWFLITKKIKK